MLSITELPALALLIPAAASLVCSSLGRPWPRRPGLWARVVVRTGLLLALADVVTMLDLLQPGGTLQSTLWRLDPRLPVTLSVDSRGALIAVMVLVAALVVSFAAQDRRPLASAALGLAALGAVGAAFAGDLLTLFIGLQLSMLGGIGLSYARQPRAASGRMVGAAIADLTIGLLWLGAIVLLLNRTATLALNAIPTGDVSPGLAGLLLLPMVLRLAGCGLVAGSAGTFRPGSARRSIDVGDWLTVVAIPTALVVLIRVQALAGGSWPTAWFGTTLDLLAVLLGVIAVAGLLLSRNPLSALRSLLLLLGALVVVGFGQNTGDGTLLGLTAGVFLEISAAFLPRAILGGSRKRPRPGPAGDPGSTQRLTGHVLSLTPCGIGFGIALLGLDFALHAGLQLGFAPALAYLLALVGLVLTLPRLRLVVTMPVRWRWPLWLPLTCLAGAALLPGWAVTLAGAALAPPGTTGAALLSAPDPLVVGAPGLLWPGGYLVLLGLITGAGVAALGRVTGQAAPHLGGLALAGFETVASQPSRLVAWLTPGRATPRWTREVQGWYSILVRLADREVAERPVWLWVAVAAAAAWVLAELIRL